MERGDDGVGRDSDMFCFDFESETGEGIGCGGVAHHGGGGRTRGGRRG